MKYSQAFSKLQQLESSYIKATCPVEKALLEAQVGILDKHVCGALSEATGVPQALRTLQALQAAHENLMGFKNEPN